MNKSALVHMAVISVLSAVALGLSVGNTAAAVPEKASSHQEEIGSAWLGASASTGFAAL